MIKQEWLTKASDSKLIPFIQRFHPGSKAYAPPRMDITAPSAERARQEATKDIEKSDPVSKYTKAVQDGDTGTAYTVLQGAWLGVPESTDCWSVPGFSECVDLLDDPPEE